MYDRILIATDGSELATRGLRHGLALAAALRSRQCSMARDESSSGCITGSFGDLARLA